MRNVGQCIQDTVFHSFQCTSARVCIKVHTRVRVAYDLFAPFSTMIAHLIYLNREYTYINTWANDSSYVLPIFL